MESKVMLTPIFPNGARSGIKRTRNGGVTIHNTGNYNTGAGAYNHGAYLQSGGANIQTSWHLTVDDTSIVRSIPSDEVAWHAGDGRGNGNMTTVAIEICVNPDSDLTKATDNAAWLAAQELKAQGLGVDNLYQHHDWSGKNCPEEIRKGNPYDWATFRQKVSTYLKETTPQLAPQPSTTLSYTMGTLVYTTILATSSDGKGNVYTKDHYAGVIGRVIPGARYPYRIDKDGEAIGWTDDTGIENCPHIPGEATVTSTPSNLKYGIGTKVCVQTLARSADGTAGIIPSHYTGTITSVYPGQPYPYLIDGNAGFVNDKIIDSDPHIPN